MLIWCLLLSSFITYSQEGKQYSFKHYTVESGLVSNQVFAIAQDSDGYIWMGTTEGLQRFDGTRYKTFTANSDYKKPLPTTSIHQLVVDRKDNLWVVTSDFRVGRFNTRNFSFTEARIVPTDPNGPATMNRIHLDLKGNVFLHLQGLEILVYDEQRNEFRHNSKVFGIPRELHVIDFVEQPSTGKYWIGLYPDGLAIYDPATKQVSYPGHNVAGEQAVDFFAKSGGVIKCKFDKEGKFWYTTWAGGYPFVHRYDPATNKALLKEEFLSRLKTYNEVHDFMVQENGKVWAHGLSIFAEYIEKDNRFQLVHNGFLNERSINFDAVNQLFEDRHNNIWVATRNHGVYRFTPSKEYFTNVSHINRLNNQQGDGAILAFMPTKWGTILAGAWGDGLYHYDNELNLLPTGIKGMDNRAGPLIWSMCASGDSNTIWLSSQPGFYAIDQRNRNSTFHNPPILENRTIRQMTEDGDGNLWFGMQRIGVFKYTKSKGKISDPRAYSTVLSVPRTQINKLFWDRTGLLWIATAADGFYVLDPKTDEVLYRLGTKAAEPYRISKDAATSVCEYDDSTLVLATNKSVYLFNRVSKQIKEVTLGRSIAGDITAVERDKAGYLWIATTNGLNRLNIHRDVIVTFRKQDGIDNENFVLASSKALPDGRLMFGSNNHFIAFDPSKIQLDNNISDVVITDFKVMNRSLLVDSLLRLKAVVLGHDNNSLDIQLSSLNYNNEFPIIYKLDGLDKEWKTADATKQAIYSYIPPGTYTFQAQPLDADGHPTGKITTLVIDINPPFWSSWWFYSLLAILGILLLYWMDRERMSRKEAIQKMRSEIAHNLHRDINNALNSINILSEMARIKADKDIEKSKEYITQIHTKSHNMIIAMDDMLWSIDPGNDNMSKTVDRMKEYIAALNNRHGADIDMVVDKSVEKLELNMKLRHESFLLFKDGIKNLVDAGARKCKVHVGLEKSGLQFTIQFDNYSCNMQHLNNVLQSRDMETRLKSILADMNVQVHKSSSLISLKVPLN